MAGLSLFTASLAIGVTASHIDAKYSPNASCKPLPGPCTVSAPGKALIAGGYLVLESPNAGISISSTSRFFTTVQHAQTLTDLTWQESTKIPVVVNSPQFHSSFEYSYDYEVNKFDRLSNNGNEFIEKCLSMVFAFTGHFLGMDEFHATLKRIQKQGQLTILLRADNDFYSQMKELKARQLPLVSASLHTLPPFLPCPIDPASGRVEVNKTGMGSSAALATSLVAALLQWFGVVRLGLRSAEEDRRLVHNLAQLAHAKAQGKIGSGFDVSAAVYGTQLYRRFNADKLKHCLEPTTNSKTIFEAVMSSELWTQCVVPIKLPAGLNIVMGDVCGGSSSTSMAKEVLQWKARNKATADQHWHMLSAVNEDIYCALNSLSQYVQDNVEIGQFAIAWAAERPASEWGAKTEDVVVGHLVTLRGLFKQQRKMLKQMGEWAGVGIEPDQQSALADGTEQLAGVLSSGVPGAGGVDAVYALVLSDAARGRVEQLWSHWGSCTTGTCSSSEAQTETVVCPLMLSAESGSFAGLRPEFNMTC